MGVLQAALPEIFSALPLVLRPAPLWAALSAPALLALQTANYLRSIGKSTVEWSVTVYRIRGAEDIEVLE